MENLAPPLELVLHLRFAIEKGEAFKLSLRTYLQRRKTDKWSLYLMKWLTLKEMGQETRDFVEQAATPQRRAVLDLLEAGYQGEPIYQQLCHLEEELVEACESEMERFVATLPFKALIPLLLFQFPAFLLLLLGPLLLNFLSAA